jgi:hypothetical protein
MKHCKHEHWMHYHVWERRGNRMIAPHRECKKCREWLALGASNDGSEAVQIEIEAARLADKDKWWDAPAFESASYGVLCFHNGGTPGDDEDGGCSKYAQDEWTGYLARVIATHDEAHA